MSETSRRQRALPPAATALAESLGTKVLHGWLQNRHQTLVPLRLNLAAAGSRQAALLAQAMAVTMLACSTALGPERIAQAESFLRDSGGDEETAAALRAALELPPPLSRVIFELQRESIGAHAFIVAVAAVPGADAAGETFLAYLAARLTLPDAVVRSVRRRYRS